jgi:hypothetical protein
MRERELGIVVEVAQEPEPEPPSEPAPAPRRAARKTESGVNAGTAGDEEADQSE